MDSTQEDENGAFCKSICYPYCVPDCHEFCPVTCPYSPPVEYKFPPPPPPSSSWLNNDRNGSMSSSGIALICTLTFFLLGLVCCLIKRCGKDAERSQSADVRRDESQEQAAGNPARLIILAAAGLPKEIIDSINMEKYKGNKSSAGSTDCSVCLAEFEEGDTLKLLPMCNHAFHIHCIDTWLRSHTNCPLCRANIVLDQISSTKTEQNYENDNHQGINQLQNHENNSEMSNSLRSNTEVPDGGEVTDSRSDLMLNKDTSDAGDLKEHMSSTSSSSK
ncbi:hypothetical protein QQ045_021770 [Rhodiola kirilowii]